MASSMWSALEAPSSILSGTTDPGALLNQQLASALSTMGGDSQYWEDSMSPAVIKQSLDSDPNNTPALLQGMKWLLACMSKGQQVDEYFSQVVKLVGVQSLEVRKMVYMYLVQYANYNASTRELSLLSINAFQRGMADREPLIRALALRALTSIHINDILQIQILGVQKCSRDPSPYVRKCAANALAKLHSRCDDEQRDILQTVMVELLERDTITMVLSSALIAFAELCPHKLHLLHKSYYKICHLLTDFDEWGQVIIIDLLARYCRTFFRRPPSVGTAEAIDSERRVRRTTKGVIQAPVQSNTYAVESSSSANGQMTIADQAASAGVSLPARKNGNERRKRVVKKGFYSDDDDDESTEEERSSVMAAPLSPIVAPSPTMHNPQGLLATEDAELAPDHRRLLQAALPLLKSRNAGVVLAVCSLQYYCGVASIPVRASMGKALVRIHKSSREIQYAVLMAIRTLARECPSAFSPFLPEFFIKAMDPPFTRSIKLDILTLLALEPASLDAVLKELRTYLHYSDSAFVCSVLDAVGRLAELARIVHDRHGKKSGNAVQERAAANTLALNCLFGLVSFSQASSKSRVVSGSVIVMQRILQLLWSDSTDHGDLMSVQDPNKVQQRVIRRILVLLVYTLSQRVTKAQAGDKPVVADDEDDDDDGANDMEKMRKITAILTPKAVASSLWILGEYLTSHSLAHMSLSNSDMTSIRTELLRLVSSAFVHLSPTEKQQSLHLASKLNLFGSTGKLGEKERRLCEHVLSMGRVDTNTDVRDMARCLSGMNKVTVGLSFDTDALPGVSSGDNKAISSSLSHALLHHKPASSSLPLDEGTDDYDRTEGMQDFRFGTLSSMVGHQARSAYHALPPWATHNSPDSLRQPSEDKPKVIANVPTVQTTSNVTQGEFYTKAEESDSESSDSSSSSSSSSASNDGDESSSSSSSSDSSSSDSSGHGFTNGSNTNANGNLLSLPPTQSAAVAPQNGNTNNAKVVVKSVVDDSDDSNSSEDSDSSDSDDSSVDSRPVSTSGVGNLLSTGPTVDMSSTSTSINSYATNDFQGMTLAPVPTSSALADPDIDRDSSIWHTLVRREHGNGMSIQARYLRSGTRSKEAKLLSLSADSASLVCVQLRFDNKSGNGPVRRLRVLQRSTTASSSHVAPKRVVAPPEITLLKVGECVDCVLGIDFAGPSDRDGSLIAKLEIKFGSGGIPVELKPSVVDVLLPCQLSVTDFDAGMKKLQGFQRVEGKVKIDQSSMHDMRSVLLKHAALTVVEKLGESKTLRLVGKLPASMDIVYVLVESESLAVCSDNALAVNSVFNALKKAMQEYTKE